MNKISGWRLPHLLLWLLGSSWLAVATPAVAVITETGPNYGTYPITAIPAVGPAGAKVVDPAFGTTVLRLTDSADGSAGCFNQYSYWPVFNKDSTRIAVLCTIGGQTRMELFDLDAATFTASNRRLWPQVGFYEDYIWSAIDPNVFFFRKFGTDRMLHSYNVATGVTTLVRDFTADLGGGYPVQWSRSVNDDVFAFTHHNSSSQPIGYKAWKRSTNTFLLQQIESGIDEVQIDKSGRYLVAKAGGNVKVWDFQTGGMTQLYTDTAPGDGFNHSDVGNGTVFTLNGVPAQGMSYRQLSTPKAFPTILPLTSWNQRNNHYSMLADDDGWALVTNEGPDTPLPSPTVTVPLQYELYQVATDGSGRVRRLVHHNSSVINYNRNAFGNISRDGKFLAWTSDWGNSNGRTDVYIAQIPAASGGSISPPADTQAPAALAATPVSASQINLSWTASASSVGIVGYNVLRAGVKIGTTTSTAYSNTGLTAATTYSYTVTAADAAGSISAPSASVTATTAQAPDTTPPTVSIAAPTGGTIGGTIAVTVNAADNVGVTLVNLRVNGVTVRSTNVAPYRFTWDSTTVSNGPVALTAVAYDAAGYSTTSTAIALNVSNTPLLDVDGSITTSKYDALTDGLLIMRYLFGLTGASLTNGALASTATRTDPTAITTYLNSILGSLDIDGDGTVSALTDGMLIIRYMAGLRGSSLIAGAVDPRATRKTATAIETYLQSLMP